MGLSNNVKSWKIITYSICGTMQQSCIENLVTHDCNECMKKKKCVVDQKVKASLILQHKFNLRKSQILNCFHKIRFWGLSLPVTVSHLLMSSVLTSFEETNFLCEIYTKPLLISQCKVTIHFLLVLISHMNLKIIYNLSVPNLTATQKSSTLSVNWNIFLIFSSGLFMCFRLILSSPTFMRFIGKDFLVVGF